MTGPIFSLAYKSQSTAPVVDPKTLAAIMRVSQRNNVNNYVTGALAYGEGHFIQVLEGPKDRIEATLQQIQGDFRHHGLEIVDPTLIANRRFPDWCMACLSVDVELKPIFSALLTDWRTLGVRAPSLLAIALQD